MERTGPRPEGQLEPVGGVPHQMSVSIEGLRLERGRGTRAGGWGRGEEPGPGPTVRDGRSTSL